MPRAGIRTRDPRPVEWGPGTGGWVTGASAGGAGTRGKAGGLEGSERSGLRARAMGAARRRAGSPIPGSAPFGEQGPSSWPVRSPVPSASFLAPRGSGMGSRALAGGEGGNRTDGSDGSLRRVAAGAEPLLRSAVWLRGWLLAAPAGRGRPGRDWAYLLVSRETLRTQCINRIISVISCSYAVASRCKSRHPNFDVFLVLTRVAAVPEWWLEWLTGVPTGCGALGSARRSVALLRLRIPNGARCSAAGARSRRLRS